MVLLCRRLLLPAALLLGVGAVKAGLVLHYAFDETSGTTAADSSGNGNTGTLTNMSGSEWATGRIGGALSFDGTNDYVEAIGYKGITGTVARTVALWVKTSTSGTQMPLVDFGGFWLILNGGNGATFMTDVGYNFDFSVDLADGGWHHLAVTMPDNPTNGDVVLYVDGVGTSSPSSTPINTSPTTDVRLGYDSSWWFNGLLDDVRFYDHALIASEVSALAAGGGGGGGAGSAPEPASVFATLGLLSAAGCGLREWRRRKKKV